jgi:hypothetical protein
MSSFRVGLALAMGVGFTAALSGCSSKVPDRVPAPDFNPASAAAQAISMYGKDGVISGDALNKVPALKSAIKRYSNGDGKVTAETITAQLEKIKESKVGITSLLAKVELDGAKLDGATVTLDPEPFMGGSISPASGVTNADGVTSLAIDPQARPRGVNPGLYKVRITKLVNGKETIPARYNKDTELGVEVSQDNLNLPSDMHFELKSR